MGSLVVLGAEAMDLSAMTTSLTGVKTDSLMLLPQLLQWQLELWVLS
jgi:hypothetical protein